MAIINQRQLETAGWNKPSPWVQKANLQSPYTSTVEAVQDQAPQTKKKWTIPNEHIYLGKQNLAQQAYQNALGQIAAKRNKSYQSLGLSEQGSVDPNSIYGKYQMLLRRQAMDLNSARDQAIGRGLGAGGLANQGESELRWMQGAENLGFQREASDVGAQYSAETAAAAAERQRAMLEAEQEAWANAVLEEEFVPPPSAIAQTQQPALTPTGDYNVEAPWYKALMARSAGMDKGIGRYAPAPKPAPKPRYVSGNPMHRRR